MDRKNLGFISFAYSIGCVLVVFVHSYPLGTAVAHKWMDIIRTTIYVFHLPLFFFVSGFLLKFSNGILKRGYLEFLKEKAKQVLVPYLLLSILGYIPLLLTSNYISDNVEFSASYFSVHFLRPRKISGVISG